MEGDIQVEVYFQNINWQNKAKKIASITSVNHKELYKIFKPIKSFQTKIIILDKKTFKEQTQFPEWASAIYSNGKIIIPLSENSNLNSSKILRSIKHEYSHAFIDAISNQKSIFWMDEGLASWIEGESHPGFKTHLANHVLSSGAIPLSALNQSFTKLNSKDSKVAYAQSRFYVDLIIKKYGIDNLTKYLELLGVYQETSPQDLFRKVFQTELEEFEREAAKNLLSWSRKFRRAR